MPAGWLDRAGVALTAETGTEVSNNHDVMSLEVRDSVAVARAFFFLRDFVGRY